MREILFRGKDLVGHWLYGGFHLWETRQPCVMNDELKPDEIKHIIIKNSFADWNMPRTMQPYVVIPETVGQYTDLTDKNGTKIFEGDIVKNDWCFACGYSVIKFGQYKPLDMTNDYQQGHLGFYLEHIHEADKRSVRKDILYFANNCEVIGNIHDNPELLEVKE